MSMSQDSKSSEPLKHIRKTHDYKPRIPSKNNFIKSTIVGLENYYKKLTFIGPKIPSKMLDYKPRGPS